MAPLPIPRGIGPILLEHNFPIFLRKQNPLIPVGFCLPFPYSKNSAARSHLKGTLQKASP